MAPSGSAAHRDIVNALTTTLPAEDISPAKANSQLRTSKMPTPRWIAHANKIGLNRVTKFIAPWAPGWAVVIHRGRKSGRIFRTPLWAFRRGNGFVIALTYGRNADWVRNVLGADGCEIQSRRRRCEVGNPRTYRDENATGAGVDSVRAAQGAQGTGLSARRRDPGIRHGGLNAASGVRWLRTCSHAGELTEKGLKFKKPPTRWRRIVGPDADLAISPWREPQIQTQRMR